MLDDWCGRIELAVGNGRYGGPSEIHCLWYTHNLLWFKIYDVQKKKGLREPFIQSIFDTILYKLSCVLFSTSAGPAGNGVNAVWRIRYTRRKKNRKKRRQSSNKKAHQPKKQTERNNKIRERKKKRHCPPSKWNWGELYVLCFSIDIYFFLFHIIHTIVVKKRALNPLRITWIRVLYKLYVFMALWPCFWMEITWDNVQCTTRAYTHFINWTTTISACEAWSRFLLY